ncbi:MAG TPA: sulfotransferase domain-containing protein, partial [Parvibaculum sp.]
IYILRNPLDLVLSIMNHFSMTLDEAIEKMANIGGGTPITKSHVPEIHSSWSNHVASWTSRPNPQLLIVRYEDLLEKPQIYFKKVTQFLGLTPPQDRLDRAIRFSSFKVLKEQEEHGGFVERPRKVDAFFREGRKDQWREKLTPEQVRRIINAHREQMQRFRYIPKDYA